MPKNNSLSTNSVIEEFHLEKVNEANEKYIYRPSINRTGLVLAGVYTGEEFEKNIVGWGTNESKFLLSLSSGEAEKAIERVISQKPPLLMLSIGFCEDLTQTVLRIANKYDVPLVKSKEHLSTLIANIGNYLSEYFAKKVSIHGCAIIVNGVGVIIIGASGVGKSEAVLELIQKGHTFVSDDTVIISRLGTRYIAQPSEITKDFLEVRGIGLIDIRHTYGSTMIRSKMDIDLVLELVPQDNSIIFDRLGNAALQYPVLDGDITKIQIPVKQGRTISSLVIAAVNSYLVKKDGLDPLEKIQERIKNV